MNIELCMVKLNDIEVGARYSEKIRGFLGTKYNDIDLLHNHNEGKFIYRYPKVQYKVLNKIPIIIGIDEAVSIVSNIGLNEDELILDGEVFPVFQKEIDKFSFELGTTEDYIDYEFVTPWIALNQVNSKIYKNASEIEKEELLKKILIGNILSMCKSLGYTVDKRMYAWINLKEVEVKLKGISHIGFLGDFKVNFKMPTYLGLGKSVSRGFGTIL